MTWDSVGKGGMGALLGPRALWPPSPTLRACGFDPQTSILQIPGEDRLSRGVGKALFVPCPRGLAMWLYSPITSLI